MDVSGDLRAQNLCGETGNNCKDISTGWGGGSLSCTTVSVTKGNYSASGGLQCLSGIATGCGIYQTPGNNGWFTAVPFDQGCSCTGNFEYCYVRRCEIQ